MIIWAISETQGSRKGHQQIWKGPIAYHTFVQTCCMATILGGIAEREWYMYTGTTEPSQKLSRFGKVPSHTWLTSCLHMFLEAMSVPYMFSNARAFAIAHIIIILIIYNEIPLGYFRHIIWEGNPCGHSSNGNPCILS